MCLIVVRNNLIEQSVVQSPSIANLPRLGHIYQMARESTLDEGNE